MNDFVKRFSWCSVLGVSKVSILVFIALSPVLVRFNAVAQSSQVSSGQDHECRLWGITGDPETMYNTNIIYQDLVTAPNSLGMLGYFNPDGSGIGYYDDGAGSMPTYLASPYPASTRDPNGNPIFDSIFINNVNETVAKKPGVAVAHVRLATSGLVPPWGDPHPFNRTMGGKWWLFGHNGGIHKGTEINPNYIDGIEDLIERYYPGYLAAYPPKVGANLNEWIDSELLFIFILKSVEKEGTVLDGVIYAIGKINEHHVSYSALNFFLTEGGTLWGFRFPNLYTLYYGFPRCSWCGAIASTIPGDDQLGWNLLDSGHLIQLWMEDGRINWIDQTVVRGAVGGTLAVPSIVNPILGPGSSFTVDILVNNVAYLTNAVINLHYNASMLTATTAGYRLVSPVIFDTDSVAIDNVNGNVYMTGHRRTTTVPPYLNTTSNLPIAYITFHVLDRGTTTLDLHDTELTDYYGMTITHDEIDGFFDNRLQGTMSVPHIVNTALNPGDYFDVCVSVGPWMGRPVEKLWGFQFIMDFDPNIAVPVDFETLGIFMQGPSEIGADYVAVTGNSYYGDPNGLTTSVPVEVARIGFVVNNTGVTLLTLHDTAMVNVYGATMTHETISGSFANTMNISVSLNTIFVEKRKWSKSTDGELITLTAQVTNTGDGITKTRAVFDVYSGGIKVAYAVTDEVDIWPGTTIRLEVELNLSPLPEGSYAVEGTVEYINYLGTWVKGRRGSPIGARTSMVKTLILYP